jgi:hypothetical protein
MRLEREAYSMAESQLTETKINELIRNIITETIIDSELTRATSTKRITPDILESELDNIDTLQSELREALAYSDYSFIRPFADSALKFAKIDVPEDSDEYRIFCHELLKAHIEILGVRKKQAVGDYSYRDLLKPPTPSPEQTDPDQPSEPLVSIAEAYWNEKSAKWKVRSVVEFENLYQFSSLKN